MDPRIGIDARTLSDRFPGIARHLEGLLEGLARLPGAGERVVFFDPRSERARAALRTAVGSGGRLRGVPVRAGVAGLREQVALPLLARRLRLDLVHAPFLATPLAWPCRLSLTLHDLIPLDRPEAVRSPLRRIAWRAQLEAATRRADAVVTVSEASRRRILAWAPRLEPRLAVVPNALPARFRPAGAAEREALRRWLGCDRFALFTGAARRYRDLPLLLNAWDALQRSGRTAGAALVLAGPATAGALDLPALVRRLGVRDVVLAGFVEEAALPALYSAAAVLVHPSPAEGFALPVLEAMACGTPVVCPRGGAADEVAGDVGWRFEAGAQAEIAAALDAALSAAGDPELAAAARERAAAFDREQSAQRMEEIWRDVLAPSIAGGRAAELAGGTAR